MTAAARHLAPLDLVQNELRGLRLENLTVDPTAPLTGRLIFRSDRGRPRYWAGAWFELLERTDGLAQFGALPATFGGLPVGSGSSWLALTPPTLDGQVLTADAGEPGGMRWTTLPAPPSVFDDDVFRVRAAGAPTMTAAWSAADLTAARVYTLPDADGTLALRSDIGDFVRSVATSDPLTLEGTDELRIGLAVAADGGVDADAFPLRLRLPATAGLRTTRDGLSLFPAADGALAADDTGAYVVLAPRGGLRRDVSGLSLRLGGGLVVDDDGALSAAQEFALDDLTDVDIDSPSDDQVLKRRGGRWVNGSAPGGSGAGDFSDQFLLMGA